MPEKVRITFVVNGQPTEVDARPEEHVGNLIPKALEQTGNAGQPPANWELRTREGQAVDLSRPAEHFAGHTLFLNLKAGVGG